jgi:hypothetical protein
MSLFIYLAVIAIAVVACVRAYHSVALLERDPEAWEKLQQSEDAKRRRRQEAVGKAARSAVRLVLRWLKKDGSCQESEVRTQTPERRHDAVLGDRQTTPR